MEDQVRISFIGLGEAAGAFITGWGAIYKAWLMYCFRVFGAINLTKPVD